MPIKRCETEIKIKVKRASSSYISYIRCTQFPLTLPWALRVDVGIVGFELNMQKAFNQGQLYNALSRVTSLSGLF